MNEVFQQIEKSFRKSSYEFGTPNFFNAKRNKYKIAEILDFLEEKEKLKVFQLCRNFFEHITKDSNFKINLYFTKYALMIPSKDYSLKMFNFKDNYTCSIKLKGHRNDIEKLTKLNESTILSVSDDQTIRLWNMKALSSFKTLIWDNSHCKILSSALLRNNFIAFGGYDGRILICDINQDYKWVKIIEGHNYSVFYLLEMNNGLLLSGSLKTIKLWNPSKNFECVKIYSGDIFTSSCVNQLKNGMLVFGSGYSSNIDAEYFIRIWTYDEVTNQLTGENIINGLKSVITHLLELSNGHLAAVSKDSTIKIFWNLTDSTNFLTLKGHTDEITSILELKIGFLVSTSKDGTIILWNLINYEKIRIFKNENCNVNTVIEIKM